MEVKSQDMIGGRVLVWWISQVHPSSGLQRRIGQPGGSHDWLLIGGVVVVVSLELCGYLGPPMHTIGT